MAGLRLGPTPIRKVMLGSTRVSKIMLGGTRIYSEAALYDDFTTDGRLDQVGDWHDEGPSLDHKAAVVHGRLRLGIPDNLIGLVERISYMRYTGGLAPSEDGYIETQVATPGDSVKSFMGDLRFVTEVFAKVNNSSMADGVGIHLAASEIGLVVRRNFISENVVAEFGNYSPNDMIRLEFRGNVYRMFRNGEPLGTWTDPGGKVATGSGHRALAIRVDGAKDLAGPRRFSPALDYVEYGSITA